MASPSPFQERTFIPANPSNSQSTRGRQRPAPSSAAKRGRKPRSGTLDSPLPTSPDVPPSNLSAATSAAASPATTSPIQWAQAVATSPVAPVAAAAAVVAPVTPASDVPVAGPSSATSALPGPQRPIGAMEEEVEGEDELLPAMADDDYSAQLSWQSQSKDNLKCVIFPSFFYFVLQEASTRRFQGTHGQLHAGAVRAFRGISPSCPPEAGRSKGMTRLPIHPLNAHIRTRRLGR
jgi:hypothetical protein